MMIGSLKSFWNGQTVAERLEKLYVISLMLVVLTMPFAIKVNVKAIFVLAIMWSIQPGLKQRLVHMLKSKLYWFVTALFWLSIISLLYTENMAEGLWHLEKTLVLAALPFIVMSGPVLKPKHLGMVFTGFVLSVLAALGYLFALRFNEIIEQGAPLSDLFNYHSHRTFTRPLHIHYGSMGIYINFALAIAGITVFNYWKYMKNWQKASLLLAIAFMLLNSMIIANRAQFVVLFGGVNLVGCMFLLKRKVSVKRIVILVFTNLILMAALLNSGFIRQRFEKIITEEVEKVQSQTETGHKRLTRWLSYTPLIKNNFLLGVGVGDARDVMVAAYEREELTFAIEQKYDAHNQYLELLIGNGFIALAVFVCLLLYGVLLSWKADNLYFFAFLIIISVSSLIDSILIVQKGIVLFAFFNALFLYYLKNKPGKDEAQQGSAESISRV